MGPRFVVELAKEDFKFSAAHFTLFEENRAEPLHGHNYKVSVRLEGSALDDLGLLVDFASAKSLIRSLCQRLDDHTLLPARASALSCREEEGYVHVRNGDRRYLLPADEVVLLPLANTSVELLALWLWQQLAPTLDAERVETLAVSVEETDGQRGAYSAPLSV